MLGDRLPETENKRTCQTSGLKTGHGPLRILSSGCFNTRELLEQYATEKQNGYLQSGRWPEVVALRELTILSA